MQQVKIFKSIESEIAAMEEEINGWLSESGARVVQMSGNIAPQTQADNSLGGGGSSFSSSDVIVMIVYEG
ncbi:MAG: hypothetical protein VX715_04765 [Planctomycetota bacterium]|nr:hypothetical protein [Planctomycetota bacterium]